jgi:hypothetical protein
MTIEWALLVDIAIDGSSEGVHGPAVTIIASAGISADPESVE